MGAFRAAARFEATSKLRVTLEGDKLKFTFEDVVTLREVLGGDNKTEGRYGVGTKFKLLPPFVVLEREIHLLKEHWNDIRFSQAKPQARPQARPQAKPKAEPKAEPKAKP